MAKVGSFWSLLSDGVDSRRLCNVLREGARKTGDPNLRTGGMTVRYYPLYLQGDLVADLVAVVEPSGSNWTSTALLSRRRGSFEPLCGTKQGERQRQE